MLENPILRYQGQGVMRLENVLILNGGQSSSQRAGKGGSLIIQNDDGRRRRRGARRRRRRRCTRRSRRSRGRRARDVRGGGAVRGGSILDEGVDANGDQRFKMVRKPTLATREKERRTGLERNGVGRARLEDDLGLLAYGLKNSVEKMRRRRRGTKGRGRKRGWG